MKSPGMYVFHVASFFSAMTSPGMMIGASDLSLLIHMKSKSPAIGKDIGNLAKWRNNFRSNGRIGSLMEQISNNFIFNYRYFCSKFQNKI